MKIKELRAAISKVAKTGLYLAGFCLLAGFLLLILKSVETPPYNGLNTAYFEAVFYYLGVTLGLVCFPLIMPKLHGFFVKFGVYCFLVWLFWFLLLGYRSLYNDKLPAHPVFWTEYIVVIGISIAHWYKQTRRKLSEII